MASNDLELAMREAQETALYWERKYQELLSSFEEARRQAEAMRKNEERMRRAFTIDTVGIILFDLKNTIIDANAAFHRMTGYSREEFQAGRVRWDMMTPPEFMPISQIAYKELLTT